MKRKSACENWLNDLNDQIQFYDRAWERRRTDGEFDWNWYYSRVGLKSKVIQHLRPFVRPILNKLRKRTAVPYTKEWLKQRAALIWGARELLDDELSMLIFDQALLLKVCGFQRFYFPRYNHNDLMTIKREDVFSSDLPQDYLGIPIKIFSVRLEKDVPNNEMKIVTTKPGIDGVNKYRQYFIRRDAIDFCPSPGDIVFDCGACIGEVSLIFAALVGSSGVVHLFDPVPLHGRFCTYQIELNPHFADCIVMNSLAVGAKTNKRAGMQKDAQKIEPGACCVDEYDTTTIDDYAASKGINRVDYIKMDIEGAEIAALEGAIRIIREHKPSDIWEIPALIKKLNPDYNLYFDHHSPIEWESVYYAE